MTKLLRTLFLMTFAALLLAGCGTLRDNGPQEDEEPLVEEEREDASASEIQNEDPEVSQEVIDLAVDLRNAENRAQLDQRINEAQGEGYSDLDIAQAIGIATFRAPRKRVLLSVSYIHFRTASATPADELNAVYDYWSTPPWERHPQEETEEEEEEQPEPEPAREERRRGWFDWIPGL